MLTIQLWHPPSIIACRLSGVFLPKFTPPGTDGSIDPLAYWLEWVEEEERKRIGYFAFMMDIENVALFKQLLQVCRTPSTLTHKLQTTLIRRSSACLYRPRCRLAPAHGKRKIRTSGTKCFARTPYPSLSGHHSDTSFRSVSYRPIWTTRTSGSFSMVSSPLHAHYYGATWAI